MKTVEQHEIRKTEESENSADPSKCDKKISKKNRISFIHEQYLLIEQWTGFEVSE